MAGGKELMLGIDGGGTKTRLMLGDASGRILADTVTGGLDCQQIGRDGVKGRIAGTIREMLAPLGRGLGDIASVCAGIPRLGESAAWDKECPVLLRALFPGACIHCVNDVQVGLYGSLCLEPGIHLVSGTGSIAMGMSHDGSTHRCGGWSEHFSDEGSGYRLGLRVWEIFSKQLDGRLPKTNLFDRVLEKTGLTDPAGFVDYFESRLLGNRDEIASYQPLLEQAALEGDRVAAGAYRQAAAELAGMALAVYRALQWEPPVKLSYSGGVFRCGDLILAPLKEGLNGNPLILQPPRLMPAQGALLYAVCAGESNREHQESVARIIEAST